MGRFRTNNVSTLTRVSFSERSKLKDIHDGWFAPTDKALTVVTSLLLHRGKVEAHSKVKMLTRVNYIWFGNDDI